MLLIHDRGIKFAEASKVANQLTLRGEDYPELFRQAQSNHTALESRAPSLAVMRVRCEDERRVRKMQCCSFEDRRRGHKPRNVKWKLPSHVRLFATPWTVQYMEFSRLEYWRGSLSLLQGIFPAQGSNPGLPHYRRILYPLSHQGSPKILEGGAYPFSSGFSFDFQPRNRTRVFCIAGRFCSVGECAKECERPLKAGIGKRRDFSLQTPEKNADLLTPWL